MRDRALPHYEFLTGFGTPLAPVRAALTRRERMLDPTATQPDDRGSRTHALAAARAALEKQAEEVALLDLRAVSTIADFFLVCTADNPRHLEALQHHLAAVLSHRGCRVEHTEGTTVPPAARGVYVPERGWILMDCGDLVVHLFDRHARDFYRIEDLWADAPRVPVEPLPASRSSAG